MTNLPDTTRRLPPIVEVEAKLSFRVVTQSINVKLTPGYSIKDPKEFWKLVKEIPGALEILSHSPDGFCVLVTADFEPYHYFRTIQEAARMVGYVKNPQE